MGDEEPSTPARPRAISISSSFTRPCARRGGGRCSRRDLAECMRAGFWSAPGSTRSGLRSCRERVRAATFRSRAGDRVREISRGTAAVDVEIRGATREIQAGSWCTTSCAAAAGKLLPRRAWSATPPLRVSDQRASAVPLLRQEPGQHRAPATHRTAALRQRSS